MGALMVVRMRPVLEAAIPAMYGLSGGAAGFTLHVAHGAVIGVGFAALCGIALDDDAGLERVIALGVGYGVVIWVVLAAIVMPIWLSSVGFPNAPPLPNFNTGSLIAHAVYGAVTGAVYPAVEDL